MIHRRQKKKKKRRDEVPGSIDDELSVSVLSSVNTAGPSVIL